MSKLKAGLGAVVLSAICLCAFGAGSAYALHAHECIKTGGTGLGTGTRYTNSSCNVVNQSTGEWETVEIASGRNVAKVTPGAVATSTLAATVGGVKFKISCSTQSGEAELENIGEKGNKANSQVLGNAIVVSYEGCSVTEPAGKGCTVPSTITTNKLKSETPKETMNSVYKPESGETFVVIKVTGCSTEALNGEKAVTGTAESVVTEAEPGTQEFTASSGSALKFGGQTATFISATRLDTKSNSQPIFLETP